MEENSVTRRLPAASFSPAKGAIRSRHTWSVNSAAGGFAGSTSTTVAGTIGPKGGAGSLVSSGEDEEEDEDDDSDDNDDREVNEPRDDDDWASAGTAPAINTITDTEAITLRTAHSSPVGDKLF